LLVLGFLCRLLLAPGLGSWSVRLLTIGTAAMLAADSGFLVLNLSGGYREGHVIDAGWLLWYGLTAAAAWHSSAASHGEEASQVVDLPPARLALLAVAAVMPPAVLILEGVRQDSFDVLGVGVITAVLLLLVMARMAGLVRQVRTQTATLARLSDTDQLTGVPNRRAWDRQLTSSVARAQRAGVPLAVALVDMDHFKRVNDTRGHAAGDRLLAAAAAAWAATLRAGDLLARYGGEEFVVLLPGADGEAAFRAAERIRLACPDCESCSVGIAVMTPGDSAEDLLRRADAALYQAKRSGRNRTVLAQPPSSLLGQD
jgi:diguanylate cyclase (GGDEF)-like protein